MTIISKINQVVPIMIVVILSSSIGFAQTQTIPLWFLEESSDESTQLKESFLQGFMNTVKTLIRSRDKFRSQAKENKYQMREIRAKNREVQANMKRQQRETKTKIKEARARQREQMRFMRDKLRR